MAFLDNELIFNTEDKTLGGFLQNFGNDLQDALRKSLQDNISSGTTRNLWQSIQFKVEFKELGVYRFQLFMDDYGDFIDKGVEGVGGRRADGSSYRKHRTDGIFSFKRHGFAPPVNRSSISGGSLRQWAQRKGLNEYAVSKSIFHRGIKATHFFSDIVNDKLVSDMVTSLTDLGAQGVELELVEVLKGSLSNGNN